MKIQISFMSLAAGIAIGIVLVLSCGDESPPRVDAADASSCDCPASEPPIVAGRVQLVERTFTLAANSIDGEGIVCPFIPSGIGIALSGGCQGGVNENVVLVESFGGNGTWSCTWRNLTNAPVEMRLSVQCLMPAQQ
jgi:hypothetical protein